MSFIEFENVSLRYPVYGNHSMSLRNNLLRVVTGGTIEKDSRTTFITALKDVSFTINEGDAVGLIGHNGAGKSTMLRTMAGIYPPSSGRVSRQGKTATVFEIGAGFNPELSGYDNIINLGVMMGMSRSDAKVLTTDIEEFTELGDFLQLPIRMYSSGMTMRLMFAISTAITPEILLLDEMFSTGDANFQEKGQKRIQKIIDDSKIFVLATHDMGLIKAHCNRIFKLDHGHVHEIEKSEV